MTLIDFSNNSNNPIHSRKRFFGFRLNLRRQFSQEKKNQPTLGRTEADLQPPKDVSRPIPRQDFNPAVHPLLAKPVAREENFVLLPNRQGSMKRKRDPSSPVRSNVKPRPRNDSDISEWSRYLSSYAEVCQLSSNSHAN